MNQCCVSGCTEFLKHPRAGYCGLHYERVKKNGVPGPVYRIRNVKGNPRTMAERRMFWKLKAMEVLGSKCGHCGFDDHRALQFDHIEGGGTARRFENGGDERISSYSWYRGIALNGSNELQLLCANCNWIKRWDKHEHGLKERSVSLAK